MLNYLVTRGLRVAQHAHLAGYLAVMAVQFSMYVLLMCLLVGRLISAGAAAGASDIPTNNLFRVLKHCLQ